MSNRGKYHRRPGRHHLHADEVVCIQLAWARDTDSVADARAESHDKLIEGMGPARTGGVTWRQIDRRGHALDFLERMTAGCDDPEALGYYQDLTSLVIRHGGILVIASAPGRPPHGTVVR